jgi:hypothetical protein
MSLPPILKGKLMFFDETAWDQADNILHKWKSTLFTAATIQRITTLLNHKNIPPLKLHPPQKGSFNMILRLQFADTTSSIIRLPIPGYSIFPFEKLTAEVQTMTFLKETTPIPLPTIYKASTDPIFGPYIIMSYVEHSGDLVDALNTPSLPRSARPVLDPDIDERRLRAVYGQMGELLLHMCRRRFEAVGCISKEKDQWLVRDRPLSINMNELVQVGGVDRGDLPRGPFDSGAGYVLALAELHMVHLARQRNDAVEDAGDCREKYIARCLFRRLAREGRLVGDDGSSGGFRLFCDDLRPANVLADGDVVVAAIDWEFTYAAPAEFVCAPPCWLLLERPEYWVGGIDAWEEVYRGRLDDFLDELRVREDEGIGLGLLSEEDRLSGKMRESWDSGDFWVSYAARRSWAFDVVYWARIDRRFFGQGTLEDRVALLTEQERDEMDEFVRRKIHEMEVRGLKSESGSPVEG